jgi:hypothetical protein
VYGTWLFNFWFWLLAQMSYYFDDRQYVEVLNKAKQAMNLYQKE